MKQVECHGGPLDGTRYAVEEGATGFYYQTASVLASPLEAMSEPLYPSVAEALIRTTYSYRVVGGKARFVGICS